MKLSISAYLLLVHASVTAAESYYPTLDVRDHSKAALDQIDISNVVDEPGNDWSDAIDIYINGRNRASKTFQGMARKDWAAAGIQDLSIYEAYAAVLSATGSKEPFLDSFNLDALYRNNTFAGQSVKMCDISIKKNLICTGLQYAQYEGVKAIENNNEKNWDEMFAFWNGVYDQRVDSRVNKGGPGSVQSSRDSDFGTSFKEETVAALLAGQAAFEEHSLGKLSDAELSAELQTQFDRFNRANLATFTQATLKYSLNYAKGGLDSSSRDKNWGEGYTYFRCGAGLMDPAIAVYINFLLDPRGKTVEDITPKEVHCKIVKRMLEEKEIGYGLKLLDLNIEGYLPNVKNDCGIDSLEHAGAGEDSSASAFEPLYELLPGVEEWLVLLIFFGGGVIALVFLVLLCLYCRRSPQKYSKSGENKSNVESHSSSAHMEMPLPGKSTGHLGYLSDADVSA